MDLYDKRENMLISKPKNTPLSCLSISIFCAGRTHTVESQQNPRDSYTIRPSAVSARDADGDGDPLAKCPRRSGRAAASQHGANFLFQAQFFKAVWTGVEDMLQFAAALWCQFIGGVEKLKH